MSRDRIHVYCELHICQIEYLLEIMSFIFMLFSSEIICTCIIIPFNGYNWRSARKHKFIISPSSECLKECVDVSLTRVLKLVAVTRIWLWYDDLVLSTLWGENLKLFHLSIYICRFKFVFDLTFGCTRYYEYNFIMTEILSIPSGTGYQEWGRGI